MTGVTGPTGPNVMMNNAVAFDGYGSGLEIFDGQAIPFSFDNINGTAIQHTTPSAFILAPNQQYMVDYVLTASLLQANTDYGSVLVLNGTTINSSLSNVDTFDNQPPTETTFANSTIITTGAVPGTLRLHLQASATGRSINLDNSNMRIVKIV
ncbi:hypothetical protein ACE41H_24830 [Paenibacillus enshidis]|uniref:BclA C-terminal domain-containing protein n=1 Tax=Paenibacillus enshidis TaxID=1458439 RepID=A0ABV5B0I9_9BACL